MTSFALAWASVIPMTGGTLTVGLGPLLTWNVTVEPSTTSRPGFGLCDTTSPAGLSESIG